MTGWSRHEAYLVPTDLWHSLRIGKALNLAREPSEAFDVALIAVLKKHLQANADPEERDAVFKDSGPHRVGQPGLVERIKGRPGGADAGEDHVVHRRE